MRAQPEPKPASDNRSLAERLVPRLAPASAKARAMRLAELTAAARSAACDALLAQLARPEVGSFLASVIEYSPFLRSLALDEPQRLAAILDADPSARLAAGAGQT